MGVRRFGQARPARGDGLDHRRRPDACFAEGLWPRLIVSLVLVVMVAYAAPARADEVDRGTGDYGFGMYGVVSLGPQWLGAQLGEVFEDSGQWGGGLESGMHYGDWLFGFHLFFQVLETPDELEHDPLRFGIGLNLGRRLQLTRSLALRLGVGWNYNLLTACDDDGVQDEDNTRCLDPSETWSFLGHGIDMDAVVSWTLFGTNPVEGAYSQFDLFTGLRVSHVWLNNNATQRSVDGYSLMWQMGFSFHLRTFD